MSAAKASRGARKSEAQVDADLMLYAVIWANQTPRERVAVATKLRRSGDVIERSAGDFLRALEAKISIASGPEERTFTADQIKKVFFRYRFKIGQEQGREEKDWKAFETELGAQ